MKILIDYPEQDVEEAIVTGVTRAEGLDAEGVQTVVTLEDVLKAQAETAAVKAVPEVIRYAVNLARATREARGVSLGAGTRGAISLIQVAKSYAILSGRDYVIPDDVKSASLPVLRHRVQISPELMISGQKTDGVLTQIVSGVEAPRI